MSKSLRTAFIRVTCENHTEKGLIKYDIEYFRRLLVEWGKTFKFDYWFILHTSENDDLTPHFHFVLDFPTPIRFSTLKNKFPYGDIRNAKGIRDMVRYLVHKGKPAKIQYLAEDVVTNKAGDLEKYLLDTSPNDKVDYIDLMCNGEIKEWQVFDVIPYSYYIKNYNKIDKAFQFFRGKTYMDKTRLVKVIFLSGATGLGKSGFVHVYCKKLGKSLCVSSSSNDPFQDYQGEDVLFLDDLKKDAFNYDDFLKILDPHFRSTARSRYHNKFFLGDTIFIASVSPLVNWFYMESPESKKQLYRRIKDMFYFTADYISHFIWDDDKKDYNLKEVFPNNTLKELANLKDIPNIDLTKDLGWRALTDGERRVSMCRDLNMKVVTNQITVPESRDNESLFRS